METTAFNADLSSWLAGQFDAATDHGVALSAPMMERAHISAQAANARLRKLVANGVLSAQTKGRTNFFSLAPLSSRNVDCRLSEIDEDSIWSEVVAPQLRGYCQPPALQVLQYGVTEMVNNARDHSDGRVVSVRVKVDFAFAHISVIDDGEGIFARIKRLCGLPDERSSLLELAKGKLTTDPQHHSGEGVFFTSRAIDRFAILSGRLRFSHKAGRRDYLFGDDDNPIAGTAVIMRHAHTSPTDLRKVFAEFAHPDADPSFARTVVPLRMAVFGDEQLMSRSQAKRVLARVDRFRTVILDFDGVDYIGQGFADEVFRVFALSHPEVELIPTHTNQDVGQMIVRAIAGGATR